MRGYNRQVSLNNVEHLPLDDAWPEIEAALQSHSNLVLVAEPGAGKTTRLPPRLMAHAHSQSQTQDRNKVLVLEPRRLAARAAASRIAFEQGWQVGQEVGYRVRFENKVAPTTRLEFLTEGLLTRHLQSDPELKDVSVVILDEFHERSLHTDLAIGLLKELQELARPDLKLIVMSATLDAEAVSKYLGQAPIVRVPGRAHPVSIHHADHPLVMDTGPKFLDQVSEKLLDLCEGRLKREGDILVFLPGAREIRGVAERVAVRASRASFDTVELHGSLTLEDQDRAIRKAEPGRSKLILATNIAESSLTLDGVGTVVDSGLARSLKWDQAGFGRLQITRISLASATQRTGRAGRQGPGVAYRLWNKIDEGSMPLFEVAEILRADLTDSLLTLIGQGVREPAGFSWFEPPPRSTIEASLETLTELGFRDRKTGELTGLGTKALKLPVSVRPAKLLLESLAEGRQQLGAKLAALLSERDILTRSNQSSRDSHVESDVLIRLHALDQGSHGVDRIARQNVFRVVEQLEDALKRLDSSRPNVRDSKPKTRWSHLDDDDLALRLLMLGYPDRLARRRRPGQLTARMIGGRGVQLAPFSAVERSEFFVCLDAMEPMPSSASKTDPMISIASRIELDWIKESFSAFITETTRVVFDQETESCLAETGQALRDLPLGEPRLSRPSADDAHPVLVKACLDLWQTKFLTHPALEGLTARLDFLGQKLTREVQIEFLNEVCFEETKLSSVLAKPLNEILLRHLPASISNSLQALAPEHIRVPSGSLIKVHYPKERTPFIEVRIQEIFGWVESPKVGTGKVAIQLQLLGPNYRPVQVTSDLASFWRTGYTEVRKELRSRYPKHSWPEDPLTAKAEAKGRPRK